VRWRQTARVRVVLHRIHEATGVLVRGYVLNDKKPPQTCWCGGVGQRIGTARDILVQGRCVTIRGDNRREMGRQETRADNKANGGRLRPAGHSHIGAFGEVFGYCQPHCPLSTAGLNASFAAFSGADAAECRDERKYSLATRRPRR
jgi:hypothetical protein